MTDINLLKTEQQRRASALVMAGRSPRAFYLVLGLLVLALLLWAGLAFYQRRLENRISAVQQAVLRAEAETGQVDAERQAAVSVQTRLNNLDSLLSTHLLWSALMNELEANLLKTARFETLEVRPAEDVLTLSGLVPSYTELGKMILALEASEHFEKVELQSSDVSEGAVAGYKFIIELTFDPNLLEQK